MSAAANGSGILVSQAGGRPIVTQQYLKQYSIGTGGKDIIWQPLRDSLAYPSAGSTSFKFMAQPIGAGTTSTLGAGAGTKILDDTNMDLSGILGQGNEFYQIGLEFMFTPGVSGASTSLQVVPGGEVAATAVGLWWDDVVAVGAAGVVTEKIGTNREYIQDGPLSRFPPCTHMIGNCALAALAPTTEATAFGLQISYAAWGGESYVIVPLYLTGLQKFTLTIDYEIAIPTPSAQIGQLKAFMRGYYIRQVT